jgi:hypothetical protein
VTGSAPCTIGAVIGGTNHPNFLGGSMYLQVQIDWGDGSGWVDVTADKPSYDYYYDDGMDPNGCSQHTYAEPGVYRIRSRATYWDGQVVESRSGCIYTEEPTVTVTEPQAAAP